MIDKDEFVSALDEAGVFEDVIDFFYDAQNFEETKENIGDAVHFILEQLHCADEGFDQAEEERLEGISFDNQRLIK